MEFGRSVGLLPNFLYEMHPAGSRTERKFFIFGESILDIQEILMTKKEKIKMPFASGFGEFPRRENRGRRNPGLVAIIPDKNG